MQCRQKWSSIFLSKLQLLPQAQLRAFLRMNGHQDYMPMAKQNFRGPFTCNPALEFVRGDHSERPYIILENHNVIKDIKIQIGVPSGVLK